MEDLFRLSQVQIRTFNRSYRRYLLKSHDFTRRFSIILGQRGIGKTTAMVQYLMEAGRRDPLSRSILYIQADHFLVGTRSLFEIAEQFVINGGRFVCFDEIHKYPGWSQELKSITDTFPDLNVIASGSSALEITKGSHDLSRRALQVGMWGLSLREFIEMSLNITLPSYRLSDLLEDHARIAAEIISCLEDHKIIPLFREYLRHGYYPFFFEDRNEAVFFQLLNQTVHATIENDLLTVHPSLTGVSIKRIEKLLRVIAASVPFTPDFKTLMQLTEVSDQRTVKTYLKYLEDSGLVVGVSRSGKGLRHLEKPDRIYLNNPNLMAALVPDANIGTVRETFFLNMLMTGHEVKSPARGDFLVDDTSLFEIGGRSKDFSQIKDLENSYLGLDDIETGFGRKIPLWVFGFLY